MYSIIVTIEVKIDMQLFHFLIYNIYETNFDTAMHRTDLRSAQEKERRKREEVAEYCTMGSARHAKVAP